MIIEGEIIREETTTTKFAIFAVSLLPRQRRKILMDFIEYVAWKKQLHFWPAKMLLLLLMCSYTITLNFPYIWLLAFPEVIEVGGKEQNKIHQTILNLMRNMPLCFVTYRYWLWILVYFKYIFIIGLLICLALKVEHILNKDQYSY